jgi:hypothetical protein
MKINKFDKIKIIEKFSKQKITHEELKIRIVNFYDVHDVEYKKAIEKLNKAKELNHSDNIKRISDYIDDMEYAKKLMDELAYPYTETGKSENQRWHNLKNKIKKALLPLQIRKLVKIMNHVKMMSNKYKKEDCDIDNFEV